VIPPVGLSTKGSRRTWHFDEKSDTAELITGERGNKESISTSYIQALVHVLSNALQNV
jgi:hypothetical protein